MPFWKAKPNTGAARKLSWRPLTNHQWLENDILFADLVLPVSCAGEEDDIVGSGMCVSVNWAGFQKGACDPVGESKSDYQIAIEIAKQFGVEGELTEVINIEEWQKYAFETSALYPHERGKYVCPLLFPEKSAETCPQDHKNWAKGGCTTTLATSIGARLRHTLDREGAEYKAVYKQRTATERIHSQAKELGIEHPILRNGAAIANQNALIYVVINLKALQRLKQRKTIL